jgi:hypothetical protein
MRPSGARGDPMRRHCGSFRRGHQVHWIQALKVAPRHPELPVDDIDAPGGDVVRLLVEGAQRRVHHHAPKEVIAAWEARTSAASWVPGASLLQIPYADGTACFSVSWESAGPCPDEQEAQEQVDAQFREIIDGVITDRWLAEGA